MARTCSHVRATFFVQVAATLALRAIIAPIALAKNLTPNDATQWTYHLQAASGIDCGLGDVV